MPKQAQATNAVYKVTEIIGTSTKSWEDAARNAVETAARTLRDLRVAEVVKTDLKVENGKVTAYRARVQLSFKYEGRANRSSFYASEHTSALLIQSRGSLPLTPALSQGRGRTVWQRKKILCWWAFERSREVAHLLGASMRMAESQRDSAAKPRVASL